MYVYRLGYQKFFSGIQNVLKFYLCDEFCILKSMVLGYVEWVGQEVKEEILVMKVLSDILVNYFVFLKQFFL